VVLPLWKSRKQHAILLDFIVLIELEVKHHQGIKGEFDEQNRVKRCNVQFDEQNRFKRCYVQFDKENRVKRCNVQFDKQNRVKRCNLQFDK